MGGLVFVVHIEIHINNQIYILPPTFIIRPQRGTSHIEVSEHSERLTFCSNRVMQEIFISKPDAILQLRLVRPTHRSSF